MQRIQQGNAWMMSSYGTWSREAARVRMLGAELGIVVDDEELILRDTREVIAMRSRLQRALLGNTSGVRRFLA